MKENKNQPLPLIGAHLSASGGIFNALDEAQAIGAECLQIFIGSPRRYEVKNLLKEEIDKYKENIIKLASDKVFIHASYLINLASEDPVIRQKSVLSLVDSLKVAKTIDSCGVIYHPGSPKGGDKKQAIEREIGALKEVLAITPLESTIIIENTAGRKKIGTNEEEIGNILNSINSSRVKICLDTAHALESGNISSYSKEGIADWMLRWNKKVGFSNIVALHINDSLTAHNSNRDRHANIGEGHIGTTGFTNMMSFAELRSIPWILEVPGFNNTGPDKANIDIVKDLRNKFQKKDE